MLPVVPAELEVRVPAPVEWRHHRLPLVRVGEAEAVAQLVHDRLLQVGPLEALHAPVLTIHEIIIIIINNY